MSDDLLARRTREYQATVEGVARARGVAPPVQWTMEPVSLDMLEAASAADHAQALKSVAFDAARARLGVDVRQLNTFEIDDRAERIVWVVVWVAPKRGV